MSIEPLRVRAEAGTMSGAGGKDLNVSSWGWADFDGQPTTRDTAVFRYFVGCPHCRTVYEMGTQVIVKVRPTYDERRVVWAEADDDEDG